MALEAALGIVGVAMAATIATAVVASTSAATTGPGRQTTIGKALSRPGVLPRERPRGEVVKCRRLSGFCQSLRDYTLPRNFVVGPLAIRHVGPAGQGLGAGRRGDKLFVIVKGGHRVTLEIPRSSRREAGFVVPDGLPHGGLDHRYTRRVATFVACERGEHPESWSWPVSGWVRGLLVRSPRCVPLLVWVDDEPRPRRTILRVGVPNCE